MPITNISGPLDWWNILANEIAGSPEIFLFLSTAVILFLAAKFRMPSLVSIMLLALWMLLLATVGFGKYTILIGIAIGAFIGWQFIKLIQR